MEGTEALSSLASIGKARRANEAGEKGKKDGRKTGNKREEDEDEERRKKGRCFYIILVVVVVVGKSCVGEVGGVIGLPTNNSVDFFFKPASLVVLDAVGGRKR